LLENCLRTTLKAVIRRHLLADDDVQLAFGNTQFSVKEDGTPVAAVTVTRTDTSKGEVGATVTLTEGTASAADYNNASIVVSFPDDRMSQNVQIPILSMTLWLKVVKPSIWLWAIPQVVLPSKCKILPF
jgi:hypothetical protein